MTDQGTAARLRRLRDWIRSELRYLDARYLRRHFCWPCDKPTVLLHTHTPRRSDDVLREEWRGR